jgi:peptidoglycan/LPS O-acetylase OafA/YrhL
VSRPLRFALAVSVSGAVCFATVYFAFTGVQATWGDTAAIASIPFWVFVAACIGVPFGQWVGK